MPTSATESNPESGSITRPPRSTTSKVCFVGSGGAAAPGSARTAGVAAPSPPNGSSANTPIPAAIALAASRKPRRVQLRPRHRSPRDMRVWEMRKVWMRDVMLPPALRAARLRHPVKASDAASPLSVGSRSRDRGSPNGRTGTRAARRPRRRSRRRARSARSSA